MVCLLDPVSDWYSALVSEIIHVISYSIGPCYNGIQLYKGYLAMYEDSHDKTGWLSSCLIFIMEIPLLVRWYDGNERWLLPSDIWNQLKSTWLWQINFSESTFEKKTAFENDISNRHQLSWWYEEPSFMVIMLYGINTTGFTIWRVVETFWFKNANIILSNNNYGIFHGSDAKFHEEVA